MEHIGFVGVGAMGEGMAACALKAGHPLTVVAHRSRAAVERLVQAGANEAPGLETLASRVDAIALCVSDAEAVRSVFHALAPGLRSGKLIIDVTTSDPTVTRDLAARCAEQGVRLVDAPVTGGPKEAMAGMLGTLLGAADCDVARATAIVGTWSSVVRHVGDVGAAHTAKLLNNFVTQGTAVLLAEAYDRARRAGVDWSALHDVMLAGAARSGTLEKMVRPALSGDFDGSRFAIRNSAKDLRYAAILAEDMDGAADPVACVLRDRLAAFVAAGHGDRNISRMLDPEVRAGVLADAARRGPVAGHG